MTYPDELIAQLRQAKHIVVLTGAGISAESGVPTFRGGFWTQYRPEDLATPEGFRRNPALVWNWYAERRLNIGKVQPNPGHHALARMEQQASRFTLITQNIDGLHHRAGSKNIIELHGNIYRVKCSKDHTLCSHWNESQDVPPRCPDCGAYLRPDVVWFGENLPQDAIAKAFSASEDCDLFFSIGTSNQVYPAASLPYEALRNGATVVEVNLEPTPLTPRTHFHFLSTSGTVLPELVMTAWPNTNVS